MDPKILEFLKQLTPEQQQMLLQGMQPKSKTIMREDLWDPSMGEDIIRVPGAEAGLPQPDPEMIAPIAPDVTEAPLTPDQGGYEQITELTPEQQGWVVLSDLNDPNWALKKGSITGNENKSHTLDW
jgi:hypothetical protein